MPWRICPRAHTSLVGSSPDNPPPGAACVGRPRWFTLVYAVVLGQILAGCTLFYGRMAPVNLQDPGWTVRQGQAVWKLPSGQDIAGDVLVATAHGDKSFVQFTKTPFPILVGQTSGNHWQVEIPAQKKFYAGPGAPPKRLIWLYLPRAVLGQPLPNGWTWHESQGDWRLQNQKTGEAIEGFFAQ